MSQLKILIVEDDPANANTLATMIKKLDHEVIGVTDEGKQTIDFIARDQPDLIMMDIHIKGEMDGIAVTQRIRASYDIPVIYMTGSNDPETIKRILYSRAYGYIAKPPSIENVHMAIVQAMAQHRARTTVKLATVPHLLPKDETLRSRIEEKAEAFFKGWTLILRFGAGIELRTSIVDQVILGRKTPVEDPILVDLTPYADETGSGISRKHAAIRLHENNSLRLLDLDSTNGTFLKNERLVPFHEYILYDGDPIRLGALEMQVGLRQV